MHNLAKTDIKAEDDITETGKGLHKEKKAFFDSVKKDLESAYKGYDKKAKSGNLHLLSPLWAKTETEKRQSAHDLYWSDRGLVKKHWDDLTANNGGETLLCPICGLVYANEMDHYIPREVMPEYSAHRNNLIPTCHDCNHDKSTKWLDVNGKRVIFNAFYDTVPSCDFIKCKISLSTKDNTPCVDVVLNESLDMNNESDRLAASTVNALELIEKKYRTEAQSVLRRRLQEIRGRYERTRSTTSPEDFWNEEKENCKVCQTNNKADFIYNLVCREISRSDVIEKWLKSL